MEIEYQMSPKELAIGALKLATGKSNLFINEDETWLNQADNYRRRNERYDDRNRSRRKGSLNSSSPERDKQRYRLEVGHRDRVKPGNIVGAIANESGLKGKMIGRIQIFNDHSLVDLPKGMPNDIFQNLRRVRIMNKELNISIYK